MIGKGGECNLVRHCVSWDRMGVDETLLDEIVQRVLSVAQPDRIILFGSAATGKMTRDSDIDLLVIEPSPANTRERSVEIRDAVGDIGYAVDVIVMRTERFERTKRLIGGIAYPANKRSEEHTSELQSRQYLVCRLLLEK